MARESIPFHQKRSGTGCRVVLVARPSLYRDAVERILNEYGWLKVEATMQSLDGTCVDELARIAPDLVLLGELSPSAFAEVKALRSLLPAVHVVVLEVPHRAEETRHLAAMGVAAFVPPRATDSEFEAILSAVLLGHTPLPLNASPAVPSPRVQRVERQPPFNLGRFHSLTTRELDVLRLMERGFSNKRIGSLLHLSVATIKTHVHSILQKLVGGTRGEASALLRDELPHRMASPLIHEDAGRAARRV